MTPDARLLMLVVLLAGDATAAAAQPAPLSPPTDLQAVHVASFACDDGERPTVRFAGPTAEITDRAGHRWRLTQALAADGFRFEGQDQALRGRGRALTWTSGGKVRQCQAVSESDARPPPAAPR